MLFVLWKKQIPHQEATILELYVFSDYVILKYTGDVFKKPE